MPPSTAASWFETARSLLTTHYSLLTTHYSLLTTHYSLLTTHYSLLTTHYSLLTTHYSLLTTHYSLLTTHYSLRSPQSRFHDVPFHRLRHRSRATDDRDALVPAAGGPCRLCDDPERSGAGRQDPDHLRAAFPARHQPGGFRAAAAAS